MILVERTKTAGHGRGCRAHMLFRGLEEKMIQRAKNIRGQRKTRGGKNPARRISGTSFVRRNQEERHAFLRSKEKTSSRAGNPDSAGKGGRREVSHRAPERDDPMTLTLEDDSALRLLPLVVITCGGKEYLALTPTEKTSEDVYFYEFITHPEGEIELLGIKDKEILGAVLDEFEVWFDEQLHIEGE